ncbi:MAG: hydroxymethylglutaryl-CoA lyase [Acidimicrobiaceae bacterium]|nr:hydroxymethylglutaryl-CoA lyase [Acidimicrobiaceae bacterium]
MRFPSTIEIVEVGPRDGLQSLPKSFSTETKLEMIRELGETGLSRIEVTSFVRPSIVPQLADAESLWSGLPPTGGVRFRALVANRRGVERATAAGATELVLLATASETYVKLNQNMSVDENLEEIRSMVQLVDTDGSMHLVGAVAMAMFCAYEGSIDPAGTLRIVDTYCSLGVKELSVATSTGVDGPGELYRLCSMILDRHPEIKLGIHLHNANGMGLANAMAAMQAGAQVLEGSICGIGGGIRLPGGDQDHGNVPTEDLINLCFELGVETGVNLDAIVEASRRISRELGVSSKSFSGAGGTKSQLVDRARVEPWKEL